MDPFDKVAVYQHDALDFMLDALGLQHVKDEAHRAARLMELAQQVPALRSENRQLRLRVVELEDELDPHEAKRDALERAIDNRIDDERERRLDDI
jgi:uncharacterized protein YlxW (UPF0749 family)